MNCLLTVGGNNRPVLPLDQQVEEEEPFNVVDMDDEWSVPVAALAAMTEGRSIATALNWDF